MSSCREPRFASINQYPTGMARKEHGYMNSNGRGSSCSADILSARKRYSCPPSKQDMCSVVRPGTYMSHNTFTPESSSARPTLARLQQNEREACMAKFQDYEARNNNAEVVWVTKRQSSSDPRHMAPVPRYKMVLPDGKNTPNPEDHWLPARQTPLSSYLRTSEVLNPHISHVDTRSEEWSTLREMLPSRPYYMKESQPDWGTEAGQPGSVPVTGRASHFPSITCPMTRFVGDMLKTHRHFRLY